MVQHGTQTHVAIRVNLRCGLPSHRYEPLAVSSSVHETDAFGSNDGGARCNDDAELEECKGLHGAEVDSNYAKQRRWTVVMVNLVSCMERMDEQIVPALSWRLGCSFHAGPKQLGMITFCRALVQSISSPLGGIAGHYCNRIVVLFAGAMVWGVFCAAFAYSRTVHQGMLFWSFNGIGLSLLLPNAQSLIADYYPSHQRGRAFGMLFLTGAVGGMLGSVYATNMGSYSPMGIEGWRLAFLSVAAVSMLLGLLTLGLGTDPRCPHGGMWITHLGHANAEAASMQHDNCVSSKASIGATDQQPHPAVVSSVVSLSPPSSSSSALRGVQASTPVMQHGSATPSAPCASSSLSPSPVSHASTARDSSSRGSDVGLRPPPHRESSISGGADLRTAPSSSSSGSILSVDHGDDHEASLSASPASPPAGGGGGGEGDDTDELTALLVEGKRRHRGLSSSASLVSSSSFSIITSPASARHSLDGLSSQHGGAAGVSDQQAGAAAAPLARLTWRQVWGVVTVPSFIIIILQGIMGTAPWNALVFLTLYLQLIGMTDMAASCLTAIMIAGTAAGGLLGGWLGDRVAEHYPNHGRITITQLSVASGVPFMMLLMWGLPRDGDTSTVVIYAVVLLTFGLVHSWAAPACNNPVFAEIVPPHMRNLIYAFDRSFEGALASLGAPLVGMAAEHMGFTAIDAPQECGGTHTGAAPPPPQHYYPPGLATRGAHQGVQHTASVLQRQPDLTRACALANAMLLFTAVPWALCALAYTGLHFTYPGDRDRAKRAGSPAGRTAASGLRRL